MAIILFILSHLGYYHLLSYYTKQSRYLVWIQVIALEIILIFLGSILGGLEHVMQGVYYLGLLLVLDGIRVIGKHWASGSLHFDKSMWIDVVFIVWAFVYGSMLSKHPLIAYDNFSHWGLLVKYLYTQGHLPVAADTIIQYYSYPPGTALFINYVIHHIGYSEGHFLLAQFMILAACFYTLFAGVKKKRFAAVCINFAFWGLCSLMSGSVGVATLLVDFVMPMMGLAVLVCIWSNKDNPLGQWVSISLICAALLLVKNSAVFFVILALIFYWKMLDKEAKKTSRVLLATIVSFTGLLVWQAHVKVAFSHVRIAKHSMSLTHYYHMIKNKSLQIIYDISVKFIQTTFDPKNVNTYLLLGIVFLGVYAWKKLPEQSHLKRVAKGSLIALGAYYVVLLFMYFFSMPTDEALVLASYHRYAMTILVLIYGVFAQAWLLDLEDAPTQVGARRLVNALLLVLIGLSLPKELHTLNHPVKEYPLDMPTILPNYISESKTLSEDRYLFAHAKKAKINNNYGNYYGSYYLFTPNVKTYNAFSDYLPSVDKLVKEYDYLVILDEDTTLIDRIYRLYKVKLKPGVYAVQDIVGNH